MPTYAAMRARNLEAAQIMADAGDNVTASLLRSRVPVNRTPRDLPEIPYHETVTPHPAWQDRAPASPGHYLWRRGPDWEPVEREVTLAREVWSWRYWKVVPLEAIGGEWLHQRLNGRG